MQLFSVVNPVSSLRGINCECLLQYVMTRYALRLMISADLKNRDS